MEVLTRREWTVLATILVYSFIPAFGGLLRVMELAGGPVIVPENPRAVDDPLPVVMHILSSFLFCVLGALQFLPSLRRDFSAMHRVVGRTVAIAGCISASTGFWMTIHFSFSQELHGGLLYWTRIALSLSMVGLILWAVIAIRSRNVLGHRAAIFRAYAIGQGASTQAILGIGWIAAFGLEPLGPLRDGMMVAAWGLNLLIAEILIRTNMNARNVSPRRQNGGNPRQMEHF